MAILQSYIKHFDFKELFRFLIGGGSAVITDCAVYYLLLWFGIGTAESKLCGFVTGSLVGFIINRSWTFKSHGAVPVQLVKYALLYICSAFFNTITNEITIKYTSVIWIAFLVATGVSTVINYLGQKYFVFRK